MLIINYLKKPLVCIQRYTKRLVNMNKALAENKISTESSNLNSPKLCCNFTSRKTDVEFEVLPTPVKSASDKKEYRVIRLKNGLTACLISDASPIPEDEEEDEAEEEDEEEEESADDEEESGSDSDDDDGPQNEQKMAAASLCIGVGSYSDPKNVPGMAHFLEHMVFMGSEKFPEENDFDSFISKRGGSDNASTDCEATTFYFECLEKDLLTALDKFAQFFISPLMNRGSITREREAIDSEFQMALPSDVYRKEQLLASFSKSESPVNTFTWGNLVTLRDEVSEDELYAGVHEFRKRHYSAHRMTLAIQARLPMEELQSYVLQCFNDVPSNNLPADDFKQFKDVFDTPQFTKLYYIQPVNDLIQVELTWVLPSLMDKYKSKPHQYVSWIIGDEGKGSLLSYLKKKVWVLGVTAGNGESGSEHNSMYALFTIHMTLTEEGLKHLNEVIETVFSYINMLKKVGPQKRLYNEMKTIADIGFKFATEETAVEVVEDLSENMQIYPPEDYITGSELYFEYDPEAIKMVLNCLTPDKVNIIVLSNNLPPGLSYDKTEKWFGTKYTEQDIPQQWLKKWQKASPLKEFSLPPPNMFLTEDFTILNEDENHPDYPEKILSTNMVELWYRKDQKFKLPIAYCKFYFINPMITESPKVSALVDFYMTLLQIVLTQEAYPAQAAQLSYSFKNYDKGLILATSGYNEKLHVLIELIVKHFVTFNENLTQEMFDAVKDKMIKYYYNFLLKPGNLAKDTRLNILINNHHCLLDKYNITASITFDEIKKFSKEYIDNLFIKVLIQGNITKDHAINVVNNTVTTLKCKPINPSLYPNFRVSQVPKGETFCVLESFNPNDSNSIVTNYYQSGPFTLKDSVIIEILMLIIQEPLFDTLRTKEQLGYDVSCSDRDTFGILGFSITVNAQATKNTNEHVENRIEEFIKQASDILKEMSLESFENTKKDLLKKKCCGDVHLSEEVSRNWSEISDEDYMFDRIKQEIAEIDNITLDDAREWWEVHTRGGNQEHFRKLSVQVVGNGQNEKKENDVQDKVVKLELKFKNNDNKSVEGENQHYYVKNISEFKENLYLYPVVNKYSIPQ